MNNVYSRWSIYPGIILNRINTDQKNTSPKLALGGLVQMEFKISRTMGFISGFNYSPVKYSYQVKDSLGQDRLSYFSVPLGIQLHPTKKISVGLGSHYNFYNKGEFIRSKNNIILYETYEEGIFRNSLGGYVHVSYNIYKQLKIFINFRWTSRSSPAIQIQTNNTSGLQLGLMYILWHSKLRS